MTDRLVAPGHKDDQVHHVKPLRGSTILDVTAHVRAEIWRQDGLARAGKFGGKHTLPEGPNDARLRLLVEEVGEVARELNEADLGNPDPDGLYTELIQTAATAVAWTAALTEEAEGYR